MYVKSKKMNTPARMHVGSQITKKTSKTVKEKLIQ